MKRHLICLAIFTASSIFSSSVLAQRTGGTGGTTFGGGNRGTFGTNGTSPDAVGAQISNIIEQGVSAEGTRFDRDSRPANAFVGWDSAEDNFGFVGVVGRGGVNQSSGNGFVGANSFGGNNRGGLGGTLGGLGNTGGLGGRTGGLGNSFGTTGLGTTGSRTGFGGLGQTGRNGSGIGGLGQTGFNRGGTGGIGGLGGAGGFGGIGQGGRTGVGGIGGVGGNTSNQQILYQTRLSVRFRTPSRSTNALQTKVANQLNTSSRIQRRSNIIVSVREKKATISGTVATQRDRQLAIALALLEPGISAVDDDLVVTEEAPKDPSAG